MILKGQTPGPTEAGDNTWKYLKAKCFLAGSAGIEGFIV